MPKKNILIKSVIFLAVVLSVFKLIFACLISTSGFNLSLIMEQSAQLTKENQALREEIAEFSSLKYLSSAAKNLGFDYPKTILTFSAEFPIALKK